MGFGKGTAIPGGGSSKGGGGRQSGEASTQQPATLELQRWLVQSGMLNVDGMTGVYDQATHDAVGNMLSELSQHPDDDTSKKLSAILSPLHASRVQWLQQNPNAIAQILLWLQQAAPEGAKSIAKRDLKDTPYYEINLPTGKKLLPLALIYNRGWPMYQVILEQNRLINMAAPLDQRLEQLTAVTQAIFESLPASDPNNTNILYVMTEADKDLRDAWRRASGTASPSGQAAEGTLAAALGAIVPAFNKASESDKAQIISAIYHRFPQADKFMEAPPNINSRITDEAEFRRNNASLTGVVSQELRNRGYIK